MRIFVFVFLFFFYWNPQAQIVEKVQAQIAEEMISLIDLKNFQKQLSLDLVSPSFLLKQMYKKSQLLNNKDKLLDFMITRNLLAQITKKEGLSEIPNKDIETSLRSLKGKISHKKFSRKLNQAGIDLKALRKQIRTDLKNDLLLAQFVISKIIVSEQDIESYHFNKHNQALFKNFEYEFVSVTFAENKKSAVLKKILDKDSDDLEKMARSLDLEHKVLKLKQKDIQPTFKKELDKLSVSQLSPVLLLGNSYYILQLKWKYPQISPGEQKKKNQIEKTLYKKKLKEEIKKWVEEKKASFSIVRHSL